MELFGVFPHPFIGLVPAGLRSCKTHSREPFTQFLFPVLFLILLLSTLHRFHVVIVDAYGDVCDNFVFLTQESIFD